MKNLVILISGNGSNLQCVIDAIKEKKINYHISMVISNCKNAYGLKRASLEGIPSLYLPFKKKIEKREVYDEKLAIEIKKHNPSYIFCLGFLHIFTEKFVGQFENKLINLHPALPKTFLGLECIEKQYNAMINGEITECGVMCHYIDSGVDTGSVIATKKINTNKGQTLEVFEENIHQAEHELVLEVLSRLE
ncbi:MAG: phosphoribosylglycinamide formyltransferase [Treponema sp.]